MINLLLQSSPPVKHQIRQKTVINMRIMALYRDYGIFCGAFTNPENLVKCILETLDQWEAKDISIALHPYFFRAYSHSRSTTFLVRELKVDTGDIHGIDITNGILPTIVPLFKERGWDILDYRGEKT